MKCVVNLYAKLYIAISDDRFWWNFYNTIFLEYDDDEDEEYYDDYDGEEYDEEYEELIEEEEEFEFETLEETESPEELLSENLADWERFAHVDRGQNCSGREWSYSLYDLYRA